MNFLSFRFLIKRIKAIKEMMKDKTVPKRKKALVIFGLIYLVLPVDLISDFLIISRLVSHQEALCRIETDGRVAEAKGYRFSFAD